MRLAFSILIASVAACSAQTFSQSAAFKGAASVQSRPSGPVVPNIYSTNFNSGNANTPALWTYEAGNAGSFSWAYNTSPAPLEGTYSVAFTNTSRIRCTPGSTYGELYAYWMFRLSSFPASEGAYFSLMDAGLGNRLVLRVEPDGTVKVEDNAAAHTATTVAALSTTAINYIWVHYKKGGGTDAVYSVAHSTTTSEPTAGNNFAGFTNGNGTWDITHLRWWALNLGTETSIMDMVGVASTDSMSAGWP